jgi:multidrug efflux pump subunit AcrA (membrane-fusion protein)
LAIQRLEALLAERQITALYDGVVLRVMVQSGRQATAFAPALEIGDPAELVIRIQPDAKLRDVIDRDTKVQMSFSSQSKESYPINYLPSFVPFSTLASTQQQVFTQDYMYFSTPASVPKSQLRVGTSVSLNVIIGQRDRVLLLAPAAIRTYRGLNFVIVEEGDRRRRVEIYKIGLQTNERWEVEADLKEGDRVVGQ